jgi:Concanavalin A-like lectin/glucanases superfamily
LDLRCRKNPPRRIVFFVIGGLTPSGAGKTLASPVGGHGDNMTRVNMVVLASLAAAVALVGLRLFAPTVPSDPTTVSASGLGFGPQGMQDRKLPPLRVGLSGGAPDEAKPPPPGAPPGPEARRESNAARVGTGGRSAELAAAAEQRRDLLIAARGGGLSASAIPVDETTESALAARAGAVPQPAHASGHDPNLPAPSAENKLQTFEFVGDNPKQGETGDLLVNIPLRGEVKPEVGAGTIQSDGLVSQGGQVNFPDNAQLTFPVGGNVNSKAGTISFDVQPEWAGSDQTNNSLVQIRDEHTWENDLAIEKNFNSLRYIIIDSSGAEHNVNIPIDDWAAGEQRQITATWDNTSMALYVNGQLVGQTPLPNPLAFNDTTPVHVGSDFPGSTFSGAGGPISGFKIYGRALGSGEIGMP